MELETLPTENVGHIDAEPERLRPGQSIDHFRVIRFLDRGAMGEVYLARDMKLGRKVALKLVPVSRLRSAQAVRDFLFEAKATARFNHPNIIAIYGTGEYEGNPYVALEYVEGRSLRQRMLDDPPSLMEVLRFGLAIAEALQEAHGHGIVHRDLKPENVLIAKDGRIRLLDFGLALPLHDIDTGDIDPIRETVDLPPPGDAPRPEALRGTPAYMAPEQWLSEEITNKTDVWALGMILTEMINREHPHHGFALMERIRTACMPSAAAELTSNEPLPEGLRELIARSMRGDPSKRPDAGEVAHTLESMVHRRRPTPGEEAPFPGLLPFSGRHAGYFFGREHEIAAMIERLRDTPVLPVVGTSGSGKTSLVEAGVIPRLLDEGRWLAIGVRPGPRPFVALASKLDVDDSDLARALFDSPSRLGLVLEELARSHSRRVLLVVDQLEEIYTQVEDPEERRRFLQALAQAADDPQDPVRVLFTLRDDFIGRVAESRASRAALSRVMVLRAPAEAVLREILEKPLSATGYRYQFPSMVDEMLASVRGEASALPLLQLTARALWDRRNQHDKIIEKPAYDAIGGVAGVLLEHADSVLDSFSPGQIRLARDLLVRLVTPDHARRSLSLSHALDGLGEEEQVLDRLIKGRVISVKKGVEHEADSEIELSHPSLVEWKRLREWLDESKVELKFLDEVGAAAKLWEQRGEPSDELWTRERLSQALDFVGRASTDVPMHVIRFLDAGRRKSEGEAQRKRRALALVGVLLFLIALAGVMLAASFREQENRARQGLRIAERERKEAKSRLAEALREAASSALARNERVQARAKLRAALEVEDSLDARAQWRKLEAEPLVWRRDQGGPIDDVEISPDGETIAVAAQDETIRLFDADMFEMRMLRGHRDQVISLCFSPVAGLLASGTWSGEVALWDLASGSFQKLGAHAGRVQALAFSPDGKLLATASYDKTVRLWSASEKRLIATWPGPDRALSLAFDAVGRIAAGGQDGTIQIWDAATRKSLGALRGHQGRVFAVAFAASGELASAGADGTIRIWKDGVEAARLEGHRGDVRDLVFAGERLISGGEDGAVRVWHFPSRSLLRRIGSHGDRIVSISIDRSGKWLVTGGLDRSVALWDTERGRDPSAFAASGGRALGADFSPDDRLLATGSWDKTIRIWDVREGRVISQLTGHRGPVFGVAFSPDGKSAASASWDKTARVWDLSSGVEQQVLVGHAQEVSAVEYSRDGETIATAGWDGTARLWDAKSGRSLHVFAHSAPIHDLALSPDGRLIATAGADQQIRIFDLGSRALLRALSGHEGAVYGLRFSPDGKQLVSGGRDGTVRIWSVADGSHRIVQRVDERVHHVDVHPGGAIVGAATSGGAVYLGARTLRGHRGGVNFVRFSHDGNLVATTGDDGTVQTFEVGSGRRHWRTALVRAPHVLTQRGWSGERQDPETAFITRARVSHRADISSDGAMGALVAERIELWNLDSDRMIASADTASVAVRILAHAQGADFEVEGAVHRLRLDGKVEHFPLALIAGEEEEGPILAQDRELIGSTWRREVPPGVTAAAHTTTGMLLGFRDGHLEMLEERSQRTGRNALYPSPVVRVAGGPRKTVVAGYADGTVVVWSLDHGARVAEARLHGSVAELAMGSRSLIAASELGDAVELDLEVFRIGYCELMARVWRESPVTWIEGEVQQRPPPETHACVNRK